MNEFFTLKTKSIQSSVHHQSITQCLHSFITNLVGCSFHLQSECLHFWHFIHHSLPILNSFMVVCFFSISPSAFAPSVPSVFSVTNQVTQSSFPPFLVCVMFSPLSDNLVSELFVMSPSHNAFTPSSPILLTVVSCVECQSLVK